MTKAQVSSVSAKHENMKSIDRTVKFTITEFLTRGGRDLFFLLPFDVARCGILNLLYNKLSFPIVASQVFTTNTRPPCFRLFSENYFFSIGTSNYLPPFIFPKIVDKGGEG